MAFSNILPDPVNKITNAGVYDNTTGTAGPGFQGLSFRSVRDTQVSRTTSGRGVTRSQGSQHWEFDISYNPMTRAQFEPVFSFLLSRNARRSAFLVALPEYARPLDPVFAACVATTPIYVETATAAGVSTLTIKSLSISGNPSPGDMFNITDPTNVNHTKAYRITRSENSTVYETSGLTSYQRRIHFVPELTRSVATGLSPLTTTGVASNVLTLTGHGLSAGQMVRLTAGGTGLTIDQIYYVLYINANTFSLSLTVGGSVATVTSNVTIVPTPTTLVLLNPKVRCIMRSDVQEYSLGTNNLFAFNLPVEEMQP
jgi:hypothetical protein